MNLEGLSFAKPLSSPCLPFCVCNSISLSVGGVEVLHFVGMHLQGVGLKTYDM